MMENQIETNENGGKQSYIGTCYRCIPSDSIERAAKTLEYGRQKYGKDNWKLIPSDEHIEHALRHIYKALEGGSIDEDDLAHATVRLMFAMHVEKQSPLKQVELVEEAQLSSERHQFFNQVCTTNSWWLSSEKCKEQRNKLWLSLINGDSWRYDLATNRYVKIDKYVEPLWLRIKDNPYGKEE